MKIRQQTIDTLIHAMILVRPDPEFSQKLVKVHFFPQKLAKNISVSVIVCSLFMIMFSQDYVLGNCFFKKNVSLCFRFSMCVSFRSCSLLFC